MSEFYSSENLNEEALKKILRNADPSAVADIWAKLEVANILIKQGKDLIKAVEQDLEFYKMVSLEFNPEE